MSEDSVSRTTSPLELPVGELMRPFEGLPAEASIHQAAVLFRSTSFPMLPLTQDGIYVGAVRSHDLVQAIGQSWSPFASVRDLMKSSPAPILAYSRGSEALRQFEATGESVLTVVDDVGRVIGLLTPSDLFGLEPPQMRLKQIGGMATPFGVYLTNGAVRAGVSPWAMVAAGSLLFGMFLAASIVGELLTPRLGLPLGWQQGAMTFLTLLLFCVLMRILPLSGIHAAEHMVVHAIERGEPLVPEVVKRMPRVHPRCGTNLAVGATLFISLIGWDWTPSLEPRILVAMLVTLMIWRPLGSFVQYWITTKPPTAKQIEMGIRSGKELLEKYPHSRYAFPSVGQRLWNSGMPQIMLGSFLMVFLLMLLRFIPALRPYIPEVY